MEPRGHRLAPHGPRLGGTRGRGLCELVVQPRLSTGRHSVVARHSCLALLRDRAHFMDGGGRVYLPPRRPIPHRVRPLLRPPVSLLLRGDHPHPTPASLNVSRDPDPGLPALDGCRADPLLVLHARAHRHGERSLAARQGGSLVLSSGRPLRDPRPDGNPAARAALPWACPSVGHPHRSVRLSDRGRHVGHLGRVAAYPCVPDGRLPRFVLAQLLPAPPAGSPGPASHFPTRACCEGGRSKA